MNEQSHKRERANFLHLHAIVRTEGFSTSNGDPIIEEVRLTEFKRILTIRSLWS
jgi:hypothetical protein